MLKTIQTQRVVMHHGRCAWRFAVVAHSWTKHKKPAKNEILKIREIDWSYCNSLTNIEYESQAITGNGNDATLVKKTRQITYSQDYFWRVLLI